MSLKYEPASEPLHIVHKGEWRDTLERVGHSDGQTLESVGHSDGQTLESVGHSDGQTLESVTQG